MKIRISEKAEQVLSRLENDGFSAFVVGGCVRDSLRGESPADWDITTDAFPEETKASFSDCAVIETGIKHGTVTVLCEKEPFEITTYRVDGTYSDNRRPDKVIFTRNLQDDLSRRDFTINAMAYHPKLGLQDFFGGYEDLQNKVIRCVGNPDKRFQEDALRIMRGIRFASVLGFTIEPETRAAIFRNKELLRSVSAERIWVELKKLLTGCNVREILLEYSSVLGVVIPEILPTVGMEQNNPYHCFTVWEHIVKSVENAPKDPIIRLAMLFHDFGKPACYSCDEDGFGHFYGHEHESTKLVEGILSRFRASRKEREMIAWLVKTHGILLEQNARQLKRLLRQRGEEGVQNLLEVKLADTRAQAKFVAEMRVPLLMKEKELLNQILQEEQCFSLKQLAVSGRDILECGVSEGPKIGVMLNHLFVMVLEEKLPNDREVLLAEIKRMIEKGENKNV